MLGSALILYFRYTLAVLAVGVVVAGGLWLYVGLKPWLERAHLDDD